MEDSPREKPTRIQAAEASKYPAIGQLLDDAPVFLQPWWLEAVGGEKCEYAVAWRGDEAAAVLPYLQREAKLGAPSLVMPPSTHTLGPWCREIDGAYQTKFADTKVLMMELIESLPDFSYFGQEFHRTVTNWLPFFWQGFEQTTRYTYVLPDLSDIDAIWEGLNGSIRRNIRKAQKVVRVEVDDDVDRFLALHEKTFERQGRKAPHSREFLCRLDAACASHGARKILVAVDSQGRAHAATFFAYSKAETTYLLSGADPDLRSSGANSLIIWEGIRFAREVSREFDFAGSMIEPIERYFRRFGARQVPYLQVTKVNRSRLGKALRAGLTTLRNSG